MRASLLFVMAVASNATASPAAEQLFADGRRLLAEGKTAEACDAFRRSQELEPRVGTLLNLGDCEERRGRLATAWSTFSEARSLAKRNNDARADEADKRAAALSPKLARLTIDVGTGREQDLVVRRNGAEVPAAELGVAAPIDAGTYTFEANAPRFITWRKEVAVADGEKETVVIPPLVPDPSAAATTPTGSPGTVPVDATQPAATSRWRRRIGVGAFAGYTDIKSYRRGGRVVAQILPTKHGTIRAFGGALWQSGGSDEDFPGSPVYPRLQVQLGLDDMYQLGRWFGVSAGIAAGMEWIDVDNPELMRFPPFLILRLAPTLRLGPVDVSLGAQLWASRSDQQVGAIDLSVDVFFW